MAKLRSLGKVYLLLPISFVLNLTFDKAVLNGNDPFSIAVLSTTRQCSSFGKKVLLFKKT